MDPATRPIGFWLKHLHNLFEEQFSMVLAGFGIGRRHWQVLNLLAGGPRPPAEIAVAIAPFLAGGGEPELGTILAGFAARGWTATDGGALALTTAGRAAHAGVEARVKQARQVILTDVTGDQYTETVRVLSVMAGNVEAALAP
jgi:hypothetical protein